MLHSSFGFKPYNALILHCTRGNETEHCPTAGKRGAAGIPKHYVIESNC